ncbi:MAG: hypothetical protein IPK70_04045 [Flavobacteriales bacterium]|jgi:hypothetical protein|nr:hypothetical protein [Flavobacteriales bacterium]
MRLLASLLLLTLAAASSAQRNERILKTDTGTLVLRYFNSGQVSTKEWRDKDDRWGRSWAYKKNGEVIFEGQTRRFAGHSSVHFSYHANGAVSKAETSDAPDGGIQWHRSTTTFDDQGNKTGFSEQGHDDHGIIPRPGTHVQRWPPEPEQPKQQEVVVCQRMFVNELFVVNPTNAAARVAATPKEPSPALPGGTWTMAPGDTIRIGTYSKGEAWPDWNGLVDLNIVQVVLGDRNKAVARIRTEESKMSSEHRKLFVVVEGWTETKVAPGQEHLPGLPKPPKEGKKRRRWLFFR